MNKEINCKDLVQKKFNEMEADFKDAYNFYNAMDEATEGEAIALKVVDKHKGDYYHEYDDLFDYVNQTALGWDHVESDGKEAGYFRLQFSWGGPSDECRIYSNLTEYWYMDWFDGASVEVPEESYTAMVCNMMRDCAYGVDA